MQAQLSSRRAHEAIFSVYKHDAGSACRRDTEFLDNLRNDAGREAFGYGVSFSPKVFFVDNIRQLNEFVGSRQLTASGSVPGREAVHPSVGANKNAAAITSAE
jgi:hypothetical protein